MSFAFNSKHGPILVEAEVTGPGRSLTLPLILDTCATTSLLKETVLVALGYDLAHATVHVPVTTGSVVMTVPKGILTRLTVLGRHRFGFPVLAHPLHTSLSVPGLLGLDLLRDESLTVDFRRGEITLA